MRTMQSNTDTQTQTHRHTDTHRHRHRHRHRQRVHRVFISLFMSCFDMARKVATYIPKTKKAENVKKMQPLVEERVGEEAGQLAFVAITAPW